MYALIMAGGSGTRLWPASRKQAPKQFLGFIGKQTLLQATFARLRKGFSKDNIFVASNISYSPAIKKQLPGITASHMIMEPVSRDIGPALGLAALIMHYNNPNAVFVTVWSDHYIQKEDAFHETLKAAQKIIKQYPEKIVATGAIPNFPHPGFRYIELGKAISIDDVKAFHVKNFKDKPTAEKAKQYVRSGKYFWNTGYFVMRADTLLNLYKKHLPEIHSLLMEIKPSLGKKNQQLAINKFYEKMPKVDFETALVMKLETDLLAIPAEFDFADVGSWRVVKDALSLPEENLTEGNVVMHDTKGSLIYNYENKLVATVGLSDVVIVNTKDSLLVVNKNDSEQIKELVKKLKENKDLEKYL